MGFYIKCILQFRYHEGVIDKGFLYYGIVNLMFYNKHIIHFYLQIITGRRSQLKKMILVAFKLLKD